jgi:hypothetical protein
MIRSIAVALQEYQAADVLGSAVQLEFDLGGSGRDPAGEDAG